MTYTKFLVCWTILSLHSTQPVSDICPQILSPLPLSADVIYGLLLSRKGSPAEAHFHVKPQILCSYFSSALWSVKFVIPNCWRAILLPPSLPSGIYWTSIKPPIWAGNLINTVIPCAHCPHGSFSQQWLVHDISCISFRFQFLLTIFVWSSGSACYSILILMLLDNYIGANCDTRKGKM